MPYIGRNHIAGDHTSNFKVLDDISSYTATFDGSSTNVVSTANETLRIVEHRFIQGQRVTYTNGGGGNIGGLTTGTAYFVTLDTHNTIKLATSLANANSNTNINLSSVGSGSSHTLTAAFDGVNQNFKATHSGGSDVRINNSTQLQIAINNVIQKPNNNSSYTEGFRVVDREKIQFKTAPTSNDVFWGTVISNTIESFDISDHTVDNFTGDGSTTQFSLSKDVPNTQSLLVTLDGVTQHSSDKSTTRSYSLITDNTLQFTAAPGNGVEIQVKHLGFAGAATGGVSGFYGRTGNVTLTSSDHITTGDITPRNINASGIVTASTFSGGFSGNIVGTSATFTGNLSVGGVLTYEDVTNVDSVGIITAQKDIHVGAGVSAVGVGTFGSLDIGGDIDVDGHTNLDNLSVAGVTTMSGNLELSSGFPKITFTDTNNDSDYEIANANGLFRIRDASNSVDRLTIAANGDVTINQDQRVQENLTVDGDIDVDGHTNLDNVSVAGITTMTGNLHVANSQPSIYLNDLDSENDYSLMNNNGTFVIRDNDRGVNAYELLANGTNKFNGLVNIVSGLNIDTDLDVDGHTNLDNVNIVGVTTAAGNVHVGTGVTIETNGQATFVGVVTFGSGSTTIDNNVVNVGTALTIGHTQGLQFHTQNLHSAGFEVNQINSSGIITASSFSGSVAASNLTGTVPTARLGSGTANNTTFLRGDSTFQTVVTDLVNDSSPQLGANLDTNTKCIDFGDSNTGTVNRLRFGASTDLEIFHNGTNNHIDCHTAGQDLYIRPTKDVYIQDYSTDDIHIKMIKDGAVELYHNNVKKLETGADRVSFYGHVTIADGSALFIQNGFTNASVQMRNSGGSTDGNFEFLVRDGGGSLVEALEITKDAHIRIPNDNKRLKLGAGDDFEIFHDGTTNRFQSNGLKNFQFNPKDTDVGLKIIGDGAVELYHDGTKKAETVSGGFTISGTCTATAFSGDGSNLSGVAAFPAGTRMLFQQSSAPTGWTKVTSGVENKALRITTGTVGSGGSNNFTSVLNNNVSSGGSGSVSAHTVSENELPNHRHNVDTYNEFGNRYSNWTTEGGYRQAHAHGTRRPPYTSYSGGGNSHNHSFSFSAGTFNLNVQYEDVIIAAKN